MTRVLIFLSQLCLTFSLKAQQTVGLFQNDSLAFNGYTLFSPNTNETTYLIDNCGRIVHTWESNYKPGMSAVLLENGNLLRAGRIPGNFGSGGTGGRMELFDWDGNLLWSYDYVSGTYHQHHSFEPLPNGNILLLAWELKTAAETFAAGRIPSTFPAAGLWPEHIVEIEPVGTSGANIVWKWHAWDHLIQDFDSTKANFGSIAEHPELIDLNYTGNNGGGPGGGGGQSDWLHANAIGYNPELDQIVISSRVFNEIWVIDHSTTTEEAAGHSGGNSGKGGDLLYRWGNPYTYGRGAADDQQFFGQHDAQWIAPGLVDEGKIMVYNNGQGRPGGNFSSVDIIEPPTGANGNYFIENGEPYAPQIPFWTYGLQPGAFFFSSNTSSAQRLPNGNTLICEGQNGRFFEITPGFQIVWEYVNPVRQSGPVAQGQTPSGNSVFSIRRYAPDYPAFEGKDLTPGEPVELNPLPPDCVIYEGLTGTDLKIEKTGIAVYPNPAGDQFFIKNETATRLLVKITDIAGKAVFSCIFEDKTLEVSTGEWGKGIFIVTAAGPEGKLFFAKKIIKN